MAIYLSDVPPSEDEVAAALAAVQRYVELMAPIKGARPHDAWTAAARREGVRGNWMREDLETGWGRV